MAASTLPAAKTGLYADPRPDWLALHEEEVLDPSRKSSIPTIISGIAVANAI
jgi:hypothetical protein